jgi:hypothetical protein
MPDTAKGHEFYQGRCSGGYDAVMDRHTGDSSHMTLYMVRSAGQEDSYPYPHSIIAYDYDGDRTIDHLFIESPDGTAWYAVTFLPDGKADRPDCYSPDGSASAPDSEKFPKLLMYAKAMVYTAIEQICNEQNVHTAAHGGE